MASRCLAALLPLCAGELELWPGAVQTLLQEPNSFRYDAALLSSELPCDAARNAMLMAAEAGAVSVSKAGQFLMDRVSSLAEQLERGGGSAAYLPFFSQAARASQMAFDTAQLLGAGAVLHKHCLSSQARLALGRALQPLQKALQTQISTMWWMFDIGQLSNTNNPSKHLEAVFKAVRESEGLFERLLGDLPDALRSEETFWGHDEDGMFINSTVIYRSLFPDSALVDKGILRYLLKWVLPQDGTVGDFGALDGHYSAWLNDTGWVTAYAFDGVQGIAELTDERVQHANLVEPLRLPWRAEPFDWVLCLEVAEHIPPEFEAVFLDNLNRHAGSGLILSWAPPWVEGEGHVNCLELDESRRRIESLGFRQDEAATAALRRESQLSWIAESVAVYRRT